MQVHGVSHPPAWFCAGCVAIASGGLCRIELRSGITSTKNVLVSREASSALPGCPKGATSRPKKVSSEQARRSPSSSDEVEDKLERERFSQKYQEMHRLVREPDGTTVLYIGAENWPFPIPLVSKNGAWYFDSDTGKQEILFRTIGENETTAIQVCEEFASRKSGAGRKPASYDPVIQFAQTSPQRSGTDQC